MKVILQRDIPKLGKGGDIVNVADGYYRNYLAPRAYAVSAKGGALRQHSARQEYEKSRTANQLQNAQADAAKLQNLSLTIIGKANPGSTKLYGSITAQDVADHIAKKSGIAIDKRRVALADPIKNLGDYRVSVRLHNDVSVSVPVAVLTEEQLERRTAQEEAEAAAAAAEAAAKARDEAAAAPPPIDASTEPSEEAAPSETNAETESAETPAEPDTGDAADGAEVESAGETL